MPFTVYVIRNAQGQLYIGQTSDVQHRLEQHNLGESWWTASRGPWQLVRSEEYPPRAEAIRRERALKRGRLNQQLRGDIERAAIEPPAKGEPSSKALDADTRGNLEPSRRGVED